MSRIDTTKDTVSRAFEQSRSRIGCVAKRLNRKFTLAEKILFGHLHDPDNQELNPGKSILQLHPDRVAMQDATAQMAMLQYLSANRKRTAVSATVHCDHLIRAQSGAKNDMVRAVDENGEVYDFLEAACAKAGVGFWKPGSGIIHQIILEKYAFPGGLIIGSDSHTPNAGGLGMVAIGVGGADVVDVMAGLPWEVKYPKLIGVYLSGELKGWTAPKDIILYLCGLLTVKGGTNHIVEYFGPGAKTISCTGKATITNMGAELGATCSVFSFDETMDKYLRMTERADLAELARKNSDLLEPDPEVVKEPSKYYDRVIEISLSELEPHLVGPHSPDLARPISKLAKEVVEKGWPDKISAALIGSCTNSSYEDISRAARIARQAHKQGFRAKVQLLITPGSEQIFRTIQRDGQMQALESVGAQVLANACGPCIGQWKREGFAKGTTNTIVSSFNRNFPARNDGNPETLSFIGSPEIVLALAFGGRLSFNPMKDEVLGERGEKLRLEVPAKVLALPEQGFVYCREGYVEPPEDGAGVNVRVAPDSKRLQLLKPFEPWDGKDFEKLPLLLKAKGKCTTDHISPAGVWLRFRGHLDNISDNMFTGVVNAFSGETGKGINQLTGEKSQPFPEIARSYKAKGVRWVVIGDDNYGEGSSREHAAMEPRYLGAAAIIVKSFARIHETNLKKQGLLPLTFQNPSDYEKVSETDRISLKNLDKLSAGSEVTAVLCHENGTEDRVVLNHSLSKDQVKWFKAGSALNLLAKS